MKLAAVFSGGKDSTFSIYKSLKEGHEIKYLITISPDRDDSYMFHVPDIEWTKLQSEALEIPQVFKRVSGEKEKEVEELKDIFYSIKGDIDGIVSGAIASSYQKSRIDRICSELGLKSFAPIWGVDQGQYVKELVRDGFEAIFTGVAADGLDDEWLGRELNTDSIDKLIELNSKYGINIAGEGGEYESFVVDCPIFKKRIAITESKKIWDKKAKSGYLLIENAKLEYK